MAQWVRVGAGVGLGGAWGVGAHQDAAQGRGERLRPLAKV